MSMERIYELSEKYQITGDKNEMNEIESELRELLAPYKNGLCGIAQINPIAGNIEYNSEKVVKYINHAQNIGLDLVIFPELTLTGFPIEDTLVRYSNLADENLKWLNGISKITTGTTALVGFIEPVCGLKGEIKKYYNSAAVLGEGKILGIIRKSIFRYNCEFNDYKYFENYLSEKNVKIYTINGKKYGIIIGDDYLNNSGSDFENLMAELSEENPDVIINCCASLARIKESFVNNEILSSIAREYSVPIICVNQVGAIDKYSFAGTSKVFDKFGKLMACAESFKEQFFIVNPSLKLGKIYPAVKDFDSEIIKTNQFSLDYEYDMERTYKTLVQGIKDYFSKTGFKRAVIGLSGGLDSTVCAVLLADSLGKENVFGISMPSKITSEESKSDAQVLAQNLGINFTVGPIKEMFETTNICLQSIFENVEKNWSGRYKKSYTSDNIQARSRAMFLWGVSNEFESCLPIATSDKSEAYMGYATINGDMSGGYAPIADVTKTKLFALARWMNKNRTQKNVIPQSIIDKRPGAELAIDPNTGKPLCAEDALMPYEFLDEVIWRIENLGECYDDMLNSIFLYEKNHNISKEQKIEWLDKFYNRMAAALYKKSILPPYITVDSPYYCYNQPITSRVNYKNLAQDFIKEKIKTFIS